MGEGAAAREAAGEGTGCGEGEKSSPKRFLSRHGLRASTKRPRRHNFAGKISSKANSTAHENSHISPENCSIFTSQYSTLFVQLRKNILKRNTRDLEFREFSTRSHQIRSQIFERNGSTKALHTKFSPGTRCPVGPSSLTYRQENTHHQC